MSCAPNKARADLENFVPMFTAAVILTCIFSIVDLSDHGNNQSLMVGYEILLYF